MVELFNAAVLLLARLDISNTTVHILAKALCNKLEKADTILINGVTFQKVKQNAKASK